MTQRKFITNLLLTSLYLAPALQARDITIKISMDDAAPCLQTDALATDIVATDADADRGYNNNPGGVITTPAFQYPIKPSDLKTPLSATAYMYTINTPGRYYVAADVAARVNITSSYTDATMIYINSTDVTLDLNGKTLRAATGTNTNQAGLTGIVVPANMSNIVIKNGQINGYGLGGTTSYITTGVAVLAGCKNVTISDLQIANVGGTLVPNSTYTAGLSGIAINPVTATTTLSKDIVIQNCNITNMVAATAASTQDVSAIYLNYCNNVTVSNCSVNGVAARFAGTPSSFGIQARNSNTLNLTGCTISEVGGNSAVAATGSATAFSLANSCVAVSLLNCEATRVYSAATAKASIGFDLTGTGPYKVNNCLVATANVALGGTTGALTGFSCSATANFTNCSVTGLTSAVGANNAATTGFLTTGLTTFQNCTASAITSNAEGAAAFTTGFSSSAAGSKFFNCIADTITQTGAVGAVGAAYGFYLTGSSTQLRDCSATANSASGTSGTAGFYLGAASSFNLYNCVSGENTTKSDVVSTGNVYGFYAIGTTGAILNHCVADHNYTTTSAVPAAGVYGFYLSSASGSQLLSCQARNNTIASGAAAKDVIGFYSSSGSSNEINGCSAISNNNATASASGKCLGINFVTENRSQIIGCDCSGNNGSGATPASTSAGIYLMTSCVNNTIKDNSLKFNFNSGSGINTSAQRYFGFYDDAADTTSVLINNVAIGQGRCLALLTSSFQFPANTSMNFYFQFTGDQENPANMIHETDNFNWTTVSTAVQQWSNISISVGEVS